MEEPKKFSKLRMYCRALDISQTRLSKISGLNSGTVSTIYKGGRLRRGMYFPVNPSVETAFIIVNCLKKVNAATNAGIPDSEFSIENIFCKELEEA